MTVIELHLDEQTAAYVQREASRRHARLETVIQELLERLVMTKAGESTLLELVVRDPELTDAFAAFATVASEHAGSDPILALGTDPITIDVDDASDNHDLYLYTP